MTVETEDGGNGALRRKLRPVGAGGRGEDENLNALGLAIRKAAELSCGLALRLSDAVETVRPLGECIGGLPDGALLLGLSGPQEARALAAFDLQAMTATVEAATMGRVLPDEAEPRRPTQTDASIVSPLIDHLIIQLAEHGSGTAIGKRLSGFGFPSLIRHAEAAELVMPQGAYRIVEMTLDFGADGRRGTVQLLIPEPSRQREEQQADIDARWSEGLRDRVHAAPAHLDAVLHRVSMPLAGVRSLAVDTLVPIPARSLAEIRLEGAGGRAVLRARLGQVSGMRAVRIDGGQPGAETFALASAPSGAENPPAVEAAAEPSRGSAASG